YMHSSLHFTTTCRPNFYSFSFKTPATTEIYTLSLHDALPILTQPAGGKIGLFWPVMFHLLNSIGFAHVLPISLALFSKIAPKAIDRKSTRLNSSHSQISYAVFCLKKKTNIISM